MFCATCSQESYRGQAADQNKSIQAEGKLHELHNGKGAWIHRLEMLMKKNVQRKHFLPQFFILLTH